ncbi:hypothetical protein ACH3VR_23255, partial [Microbacterium sp. B2969]
GWRAGALSAVAAAIRQRVGQYDVEGFAAHRQALEELRAVKPEAVAAGEQAGDDMSIAEAYALALPEADTSVQRAIALW